MDACCWSTRLFGLLLVGLVLSGCAGSGAAGRAGPAADTFVAADGQVVRCIDETATGSRVPQRVCRTEAEWRRLEESGKDYARGVQGPQTASPET